MGAHSRLGTYLNKHGISPALRAECNTAHARSDKSIGLQAILNGNAVNKFGGSCCADLTATDACEAIHPGALHDDTKNGHVADYTSPQAQTRERINK